MQSTDAAKEAVAASAGGVDPARRPEGDSVAKVDFYEPMTPKEFVELREKLDLSGYAVAKFIGISRRQARRYEAADGEIPLPVAYLLRLYVKHGVPPHPDDQKKSRK